MSDAAEPHPAARHAEQLAWAVWVGDRRTGECVAVVADSEAEARTAALGQSDAGEVRHIDGPFQDGEPAHFEFEFITEHRETVTVEAPCESYAKETAEAERNYSGRYVETIHTEVRRVAKDE